MPYDFIRRHNEYSEMVLARGEGEVAAMRAAAERLGTIAVCLIEPPDKAPEMYGWFRRAAAEHHLRHNPRRARPPYMDPDAIQRSSEQEARRAVKAGAAVIYLYAKGTYDSGIAAFNRLTHDLQKNSAK